MHAETRTIARPIATLVALTMMVSGALMLGTATTARIVQF